jgi:hypothetical protein
VTLQDQQKKAGEAALRDMLQNQSESERDRILQQYQEQLRKLNSRMDDNRNEQVDKVKAKLAARKRMKEELDKERAVNKELDRITKKHVKIPSNNMVLQIGLCEYCEIAYFWGFNINCIHILVTHKFLSSFKM